jgi:hypothetical protein
MPGVGEFENEIEKVRFEKRMLIPGSTTETLIFLIVFNVCWYMSLFSLYSFIILSNNFTGFAWSHYLYGLQILIKK